MKPLLWRIAGCVLFLLPIAALAWFGRDFFAAMWTIFGIQLCWFALAVVASLAGGILTCALFSLGAICFDKAKRPPK
jgi:hypothetical protein